MGKFLKLKWYSWILLGFQLFSQLLLAGSFIIALLSDKLRYKEAYLKHGHHIGQFIVIVSGMLGCLGLILLIAKNRKGWILTLSALFFDLFLFSTFIGHGIIATLFYSVLLILCLLTIIISDTIRRQFEITKAGYIWVSSISLFLFSLYYFSYDLTRLMFH